MGGSRNREEHRNSLSIGLCVEISQQELPRVASILDPNVNSITALQTSRDKGDVDESRNSKPVSIAGRHEFSPS